MNEYELTKIALSVFVNTNYLSKGKKITKAVPLLLFGSGAPAGLKIRYYTVCIQYSFP